MQDWIDGYCHDCYGTGEIVVCGWCEHKMPHASCDDSWTRPCGCKLYDHKHRFNNGGLWLRQNNGMWYVCQDFVNFAMTKPGFGGEKDAAIKHLEASLEKCRKQVKEDLQNWPEQDRMSFYEWSRGERRSL